MIIQSTLFYATAIFLGLEFSFNIVLSILISIPISILFISLGILVGSVTSAKSSSGVGSIIVQLVAFTSGMYFPSDITGETFDTICKTLPFSRVLDTIKSVLNNNYINILPNSIISAIYISVITIIAIYTFKKKMVSDNKY